MLQSYLLQIMQSFKRAESYKKPDPLMVLDDVYAELTPALKEQKSKLTQHLQTYAEKYNLAHFEPVGSSSK